MRSVFTYLPFPTFKSFMVPLISLDYKELVFLTVSRPELK
jgi:hypothetical protein